MSLILAPKAARGPTEPATGIFWRVGDRLVVERIAMTEAEPYGDCLTHAGGHYERWEVWRGLGPAGLRAAGLPAEITGSEYDGWPRGRVVYEVPARRFVLYADRRLHRPEVVVRLRDAFGLAEAAVLVRGDPHYRRASPSQQMVRGSIACEADPKQKFSLRQKADVRLRAHFGRLPCAAAIPKPDIHEQKSSIVGVLSLRKVEYHECVPRPEAGGLREG